MTSNAGRIVAASLAALLTSTVMACGSGTPGKGAEQDKGVSKDGKVVVEFWHRTFTPVENAWYKKVVADYNAAQDKVVVRDSEIPIDAWEQKVKAAQAAGKMPDIYTHPGRLNDAVRAGQVRQLDDVIPAEKLDQLNDKAQEIAKVDGKHHGYPLVLEPQSVLFFNKEMFTKAGLDPNKPPKTWDELYQYCEKIKPTLQQGQFCISTAGDQETFAWASVGQQVNTAGHLPISKDWSKADAKDPKYAELIGFYKTLYDKGYLPKQPLAKYVVAQPYGEGKTAMMVSGSWAMSELGSDYRQLVDKTGVAPLMTKDADPARPTATVGNFKWVLDGKTTHAKEAADFMTWALAGDPKILEPFFVDTQFTKAAARKDVQQVVDANPGAAKATWSKTITEKIVPTAAMEPAYPEEVSKAMGLAIEKGMTGTDPNAALDEANATIQKVIDREQLAGKAPKE